MSNVKSPYNFVPAPKEDQVYKPKWAEYVSHDIPFEEGESGEIEIEITAETPIFIRDGQKKLSDEDKKEPAEFSHFIRNGQKQYFIPATSLKGMVRNVLEIMSFSRLNKELVQNNRFSQRDVSKADTQYMLKYDKKSLCAGWLKEDKEGGWSIEKCDDFAFIEHQELKEKLNIPFRDLFLVTNEERKPKNILKTAQKKYQEIKRLKVSLTQEFKKEKQKEFPFLDMAFIVPKGIPGTLVVTGQPAARKEIPGEGGKGKTREFVFFDVDNPEVFTVCSDVQKDFRFIYGDHDRYNISKDWEYFRDNFLEKGKKVPVFFSPGENKTVKHLGLAYMYKLPYDHNINGLNPIKNYNSDPDLAHAIFGQATKENSLKGRVFVGHALADSDTVKINKKPEEEILSSPKASFFPFYLNQFNKNGKYFTYDDANAELRGFKRYPVRTKETSGSQFNNEKIISKFFPIQKEVKFQGKIRFHNLKKEELGALLSALTFHDNADLCFHSLGGAKPYGFGRISLKVKLKTLEKNWGFEECLIEFENLMNRHHSNWINSDQITELFAMAIPHVFEEKPIYPSIKEFQKLKGQKERLENYSTFSGNNEILKKIKPASVKYQPQEKIDFQFQSYLDLQKLLNDKFEIYGEFHQENKLIIYDYLIKIIQKDRHKASLKKIRKRGHWDGNILNWLGADLREKLQKETGIDIID